MEHMATALTDLPEEMLVKIFSFLNQKELPNLFLVCKKFNAAAKHPSLWRRGGFEFSSWDKRKIKSFCKFFGRHPFFRAMLIMGSDQICKTTVKNFNNLFQNLKHLTCLKLNFDLSDIVLPQSLLHLYINISLTNRNKNQFRFLDQCPNIERFHLEDFYSPRGRLPESIRSVLLKYQLTLSSIHLRTRNFDKEWIPLIENCVSLKEFGIYNSSERPVNLSKLFGSSLRSRLEILYVENINTLESFSDFEFPELKVLKLNFLLLGEELMDILPVIKRMPKLHTVSLFGIMSNPNVSDVCCVVKSCETLRYLSVKNLYGVSDILEEHVIKELNEGCSEENRWNSSSDGLRNGTLMRYPSLCYCWEPFEIIPVHQIQHRWLHWDHTGIDNDIYSDPESGTESCESEL